MKSFKLLVAGAFAFALLTPLAVNRGVNAQAQVDSVLQCAYVDIEFGETTLTNGCDLSIQKEVSVNGGAFVDANTSADAAQAVVGDSLVWRITITDTSDIDIQGYYVTGTIRAYDDPLPTQVSYASYSTSDGSTFDPTTGTWEFTLGDSNTPPVTLTLNTTATSVGLAQNTAFLAGYLCDGWCEYSDSYSEGNLDEAWAEISAAPVVLGDSTPVVLAATGTGLTESLVAGTLILTTFGLLGYSRFARKEN